MSMLCKASVSSGSPAAVLRFGLTTLSATICAPSLRAVMRDRNLELPWEVLRRVLERIAAVNGSTGAYQDLAASGRNVIIVPARGLLPGVRHWLNRAAHWLKTLH